jgi:hypothetical protein
VHKRRSDESKPVEVGISKPEPYEPPRLTVLGSFRELTAGESYGGLADDSGKTWP